MEQQKKEMLAQKLSDALQENDTFCQAFVSAENAITIQKLLCDNGINVSLNDVEEMYSNGVKGILKKNEDGELYEEDLNEVAGGGWFRGTLRAVGSTAAGFLYGCFCGLNPAAAAGAPYVAVGLATWTAAGYLK